MAAGPSSPGETDTEPEPRGPGSRLNVTFLWGVAVLVLAMSLIGRQDESSDTSASPPPRATQAVVTPTAAAQPGGKASTSAPAQPVVKQLPRARPQRLLIPKISVNAPFTDLAIGPSGQLNPPPADDVNLVGWHARGASPGEVGTAIIAGHVDTTTSAAVFARLSELRKGDRFHVERADGRRASFVVDSVESFDKDHFPDDRVYADTPQAQARLITCAGDYDRVVRDYTENLVVFAHLI